MKNNRRNENSVPGCVIVLVLGLLFAPFLGGYWVLFGDGDKRIIGWVLLIVGLFFYINVMLGS